MIKYFQFLTWKNLKYWAISTYCLILVTGKRRWSVLKKFSEELKAILNYYMEKEKLYSSVCLFFKYINFTIKILWVKKIFCDSITFVDISHKVFY